MGLFGRGRQQLDENGEQVPIQEHEPPAPPESVSFETVLGPGTRIEGTLTSPGSVRLDGIFLGKLELEGNALVGEHARVTADINAANVTIAGAIRGNVSGQRVQLLRTGRVWGDIQASSISTEEGAFIRGTITMKGGDIPPIFAEMAAETGTSPPPIDLPEVPETGEFGESEMPSIEAVADANAEASGGLEPPELETDDEGEETESEV